MRLRLYYPEYVIIYVCGSVIIFLRKRIDMFGPKTKKSKYHTYSLRFFILLIFTVSTVVMLGSFWYLAHIRFLGKMTKISYKLMETASTSAYHQILNQMKNTETVSKSAAYLFETGVIDHKSVHEMVVFTSNIFLKETTLFPSVYSVFWGANNGTFVMAERQDDGSITSEIINRSVVPPIRTLIHRTPDGQIKDVVNSNDLSYDPRIRPWYQAVEKTHKTAWLDVYPYRLTGYLSTSVSSPVINNKNRLDGVINFTVRLDYLRRLIEQTTISDNGVIFIISRKGELIAYPHLEQYRSKSLADVHSLKSAPWIAKSFDEFLNTGFSKFSFVYNKQRYLATYQTVSNFGGSDWMIAAVAPENDFVGEVLQAHIRASILGLLILMIGSVVMSELVSRVIKPLNKITKQIDEIKNFDLESNEHIHSRITEIAYISDKIHAMRNSLRSFGKYVPASLVRELIETGEDVHIGGVKKTLAIFFSDIQNFTSIAEHADPKMLTIQICEYFDELSKIIARNHGTIDKYIGDAIMVFWGAPLQVADPGILALKTAIECIKRSNELNVFWKSQGRPEFITRVGIHIGDAIVGNLGSSERLNYTVIGDSINLTSRLVDMNKTYGTQIIVSETVHHIMNNQFNSRMLDYITARGRANQTYIYEVITNDGQLTYDLRAYNVYFAKGFEAYQNRNWDEAIQYFLECNKIYPADKVASLFIVRCNNFKIKPPGPAWKGETTF